MTDAVISRIHKLMALTVERGATEQEAALAAEHVQRLLAEHNLSLFTIEASGASTGDAGRRVRERGVGSKQVYKWQRTLMRAVAGLNYCAALERFTIRHSRPSVFDGYDLIGRVDNVVTTQAMFEYLLQTIERLARGAVDNDPAQFFTRFAHSFKEGCSDRLVERLEDKQREIIQEQERRTREDQARSRHPGSSPSNLPAVLMTNMIQREKDLNEDLRHGYEPGTTERTRREWEAEREQSRAERESKEAEFLAAGYPPDVAYYMSIGYSEARAYDMVEPAPEKIETEAQRRKREGRAERADQRYREQAHNRQQRERNRLDNGAYNQGQRAGNDVGLDRQVDAGRNSKLT